MEGLFLHRVTKTKKALKMAQLRGIKHDQGFLGVALALISKLNFDGFHVMKTLSQMDSIYAKYWT